MAYRHSALDGQDLGLVAKVLGSLCGAVAVSGDVTAQVRTAQIEVTVDGETVARADVQQHEDGRLVVTHLTGWEADA